MRIGKLIIQYSWLRELLLFLFLVLVTFLNEREDFYSEHSWVDSLFIFILLYLHVQVNRFSILNLLDKGRYLVYIMASLALVILFSFLAFVCDFYFTNVGWFDEVESVSRGYLIRFYLFSFSVTIPLLVAVHSVFKQFEQQIKRERDKVVFREMELKLLKGQTNPHFLFNALNGLYGLSLEKPNLLPDKILQLADIMRYHVQWSNVQWISVKQEIDYLHQYIDFESERRGTYVKVSSKFLVAPVFFQCKIAPMIFIFFVENAFKHVRRSGSKCYIDIEISSQDSFLMLSVENTYDEQKTNHYSLQIGIENVKRRLEMLYLDSFILDIQSEKGLFKVVLKLKIQPNSSFPARY